MAYLIFYSNAFACLQVRTEMYFSPLWMDCCCIISCLKKHAVFFLFMSLLKFFLTIAVPFYLTELGYCADLISRGNHIGGRKHDLLINKCLLAFSSKWQSSQRLVNTQVLMEMQTVNSNLCRMDWIKWKEEWTAKGFTLWTKMLGHL